MLIDWDQYGVSTTFEGLTGPGKIDQNTPHQLAADSKEMGPIFPRNSPNVDETKVELVDQSRRLESAVPLFRGHVTAGEAV